MRLLVTRPEPDAGRTAAKLAALGHEPMVQPLLTIAFSAPPRDLPVPGALLVTSQNAVRALARWPQSRRWQAVPIFAAGPATSRALTDLGYRDVRTGARDAGSLAEIVLATLSTDAGPILYPAARDRAGALAGGLTARGYDVRTVEAYRADPVERLESAVHDAFFEGTIDGVLVYSGRTARTLVDLGNREDIAVALGKPRYFVISEHVAGIVRGVGARVKVAPRPDEDSLLALIPAGG